MGKGRKPPPERTGGLGVPSLLSSVVSPQLPAFWKKEGLRMRCTMWPFINLGWPKTEVLCMVGVMWKTVETGLEKKI